MRSVDFIYWNLTKTEETLYESFKISDLPKVRENENLASSNPDYNSAIDATMNDQIYKDNFQIY